MIVCIRCGRRQPPEDFYDNPKAANGKQSYCKPCTHEAAAIKKQLRREYLDAVKDVPCMDCGLRYPPFVMDFDHRDPGEKAFQISGKGTWVSEARLTAEIEKCDIVCANCHRIRTWGTVQGDVD